MNVAHWDNRTTFTIHEKQVSKAKGNNIEAQAHCIMGKWSSKDFLGYCSCIIFSERPDSRGRKKKSAVAVALRWNVKGLIRGSGWVFGAAKPLCKRETMARGHVHMSKPLERHNTECKVQYKLGIRIARPVNQHQPVNCVRTLHEGRRYYQRKWCDPGGMHNAFVICSIVL